VESAHLEVGLGFFRGGARPPKAVIRYIDEHKEEFGVEPICTVLQFAPSTYYAAKARPPSARSIADASLGQKIQRIYDENYGVYGIRKVWHQLLRQDVEVGRDQVWRIMAGLGIQGVRRGKARRTTIPGDLSDRPADLVDRQFVASAPNCLWLADITYVWTASGFCYTSFITDAFARRIVGWRVSKSLRTDLALDALEMAICTRHGEDLSHLVHHSDRGVQGGFNWTSQHLDHGGVHGTTVRMDSHDRRSPGGAQEEPTEGHPHLSRPDPLPGRADDRLAGRSGSVLGSDRSRGENRRRRHRGGRLIPRRV
jgi:putative transposase